MGSLAECKQRYRLRRRAGLQRLELPHGSVPGGLREALFLEGRLDSVSAPAREVAEAVEVLLREFCNGCLVVRN